MSDPHDDRSVATAASGANAVYRVLVVRGGHVVSGARRYAYDDEGYRQGLKAEELSFQRLYGPWEAFSPERARELFDPLGFPWWIAGGWAIEAFTGVEREHGDIDVSMFRRDLPTLRRTLAGRFHVWAAGEGALTPLVDDATVMPVNADQVWLRAHALAPWRGDVLLNPDQDGRWVSRRDSSYVAELDAVTWQRDGIRYLRPEVVLAFKAKLARPKDEADLTAALPLLDEEALRWLADFLDRINPGHAWLDRL